MSLEINELRFDDLTEEQQENVPDNGSGKDYASYIEIKLNGAVVDIFSDAMEPEDVTFNRDLSWIAPVIKAAYEAGLEEGKK